MSEMVRIAQGCHVPREHANDLRSMCAALLAVGPAHAVVVLHAAATFYGLWLPPGMVTPQLATTRPDTASRLMARSRRPELKAYRWQVPAEDLAIVEGLPVTSLVRTWCDLGAHLSLPDLVAAGDSALRMGVTVAEIDAAVARLRGRRGIRNARAALALLDGRSRSRPESHLRVAVVTGGLSCFEVNVPIHDANGGWLAEPDLSCKEARIALEYQGANHADVDRMRRDITRGTDLRHNGWLMLPYGPAQVFKRPWEIAPELRSLVAVRAPQLLSQERVARNRSSGTKYRATG